MYERSECRRREERVLFDRLLRADPSARSALVVRFLPMARKLAWGFRASDDVEDLEQVAAIGLVKAIDRFDPGRGLAFSTYAMPTILGELRHHFRSRGWSVRVPRSVQELAVRVERVSGELVAELGRSPTVAEVAERADCTNERVCEALVAAAARHTVSLDQPSGSPGHEVAVEERGYAEVESAETLAALTREMHPRDRRVLEMRFHEDHPQSQIAEVMGMSQAHVSRVIQGAIEQLQLTASRQA